MPKLIEESGLLFDPPDTTVRLEAAPYFVEHFKRYGLGEMDFVWWDPAQQIVHLLELKDYSLRSLPPDLVGELVQKATDCLLLLGSIHYGLPHADGIKGMLPSACHAKPTRAGAIRLTFVLKMARPDQAYELQSMRDALLNRLKGRLELLGLRPFTTVLLLDQWTARERGVPIVLDEEETPAAPPPPEAKSPGRGGPKPRRR